MLEALFNYISTQGISGIKRITAGVLSLFIASGQSFGGNMGDTQKMIVEGLDRDAIEISLDFELSVQADELTKQIDQLNEALEKEVGYANNPDTAPKGYPIGFLGGTSLFFLFNEKLEFTPTKLVFPQEDIPGIYENGELNLDGNINLTYSKSTKCGTAVFDITDTQGDYSLFFDDDTITFSPDLTAIAVEFLDEDIKTIYNEHFNSLAYSCDIDVFFSMLLDEDGKLRKLLDGFSFYSHSLPEALTSLSLEEIVIMLEDQEFVSKLSAFIKEYTRPISRNFIKRTVSNCDARIFELTGEEYLDYRISLGEHVKEDKVIDTYKALTDYVHKTEALSFLADSELFSHTDKKEIRNAFATRTRRWMEIAKAMNETPISRPVPDVNLLRFYYKNSKLKHTIFEEDGNTHTRLEFVVAKSNTDTFVTLNVNSIISNAKEEIPTPDSAIAIENRINDELFDNKLAQKEAQRKGVKHLEITWNSKMESGTASPEISETAFELEYKNADKSRKASLAHLVDGSVYLPLRQLMENAGYEVSWDAEAYKAFVTVDGKKIEMTGKLIDSKTYVKVRDFEKLGTKVDYTENMHYANAHDDFSKECKAVITFNE